MLSDNEGQIHEDQRGVYLSGIQQISVGSFEQLMNIIKPAIKKRSVCSTSANNQSSRSHAILQIILEQRQLEQQNKNQASHHQQLEKFHKKAIMRIVDLAGSQRLSKTASDGLRLDEAKIINKSIASLGNCINVLATQRHRRKTGGPILDKYIANSVHIPYRNSKLTRILSQSLNGNSKLTICACVTPLNKYYDQTYSTLLFSSKAMQINNYVKTNIQSFYKIEKKQRKSIFKEKSLFMPVINQSQNQNIKDININQKLETNLSAYIKKANNEFNKLMGPLQLQGNQSEKQKKLSLKYIGCINHLTNQLIKAVQQYNQKCRIAQLEEFIQEKIQ